LDINVQEELKCYIKADYVKRYESILTRYEELFQLRSIKVKGEERNRKMRKILTVLLVLVILATVFNVSNVSFIRNNAYASTVSIIVDNTDSGFSTTGTWTTSSSTSGYYGADYLHDGSSESSVGDSATWTPNITTAGFYKIYMRWSSHANRPDSAPVEIGYEGGTQVDSSITVNQQNDGGKWVYLGTYYLSVSASGNYVKIEGDDDGYTIADAVLFELSYSMSSSPTYWPNVTPEPEPTPLAIGSEIIVDNTDSGFSTYIDGSTSAWSTSSHISGYYGTDYAQCNTKGNWNYAKYAPSIQTPGEYEVYIRWPAYSNRVDNAGVVVGHRDGVDTSITVDMTTNGGQWNLIGSYNLQGAGKDYVGLVCDDDGYLIADAVKFKLISYESEPASTSPDYTGVRKVNIVKDDSGNFSLTVDGQEFYAKGVCGVEDLTSIEAAGANSARTYDASDKHMDGWEVLDEAESLGMKIVIGLWLPHDGEIDFTNDKDKVQAEIDKLKAYVDKYKDHPAVLAWGVGNEVDTTLSSREVYDAINELAQYIKDNDKNHPTIAVLAGSSPIKVINIRHYAPAIDIIAVNSYKHIDNVHENVVGTTSGLGGWIGPYMVTEFGCDQSSPALTESDKTTWGVTCELPSHYKSAQYTYRYNTYIAANSDKCIGSYVFKGADVVGVTHTWYNMLLNNHTKKTGIYDAMYKAWNGTYPTDRAPGILTLTYNGKVDTQSVTLSANTNYIAHTTFDRYSETDYITFVWEIREEYEKGATGKPGDVVTVSQNADPSHSTDRTYRQIQTPSVPGYYRLFIYIYDSSGHVGTASLPFKVQ